MELEKLTNEELFSMYEMVKEFCAEYARMTDNYSLATGDKTFSQMNSDITNMIEERQKFFTYKIVLGNEIKKRIIDKFKS